MRRLLIFSLTVLMALTVGCSDTPDGSNGSNTNGGNSSGGSSGGSSSGGSSGGGCTGAFCLEDDVQISADPSQLLFGDIPAGQSTSLKVRIKHIGNSGVLKLTSAKFDTATEEFSIDDFEAKNINSGQLAEFTVTYKPVKSGAKLVRLVISNNDNDADDREFKIPCQVKAAAGNLKVSPSPIDFGAVASKACKDLTVKVFNSGQKPVKVVSASLSPSGSPDFTIKQAPDTNVEVAPLGSTELVLTFCPKPGDDNDATELSLEDSDGNLTIVTVIGAEVAPKILVVPPVLDYGSMQLNGKATRSFKIFNQGIADLQVTAINVSVLSKIKTLTLSDSGPFTLEAGKQKLIDVELEASVVLPNDGAPVVGIVIESNDGSKPQLNVPVFAKTETGSLKVTPSDLLDFAIVGKGVSVERKVELFNQGTAEVEVKSVTIVDSSNGEFELVAGPFVPVSANPSAYVMKAAEYQKFQVKFTAKGPVGAQAKGKLVIESDDPDVPSRTITLIADRAEGSQCNIKIIPGVVNFGVLGYGQSKTLAVTVKNIGSGYCGFQSQKVLDCPSGGLGPFGGGSPVCVMIGLPKFQTFAPSTKLFNLGPGQSGKVNVLFTSPNDGGLFSDPKSLLKYFGYLAIEFKDQSTGLTQWYPKDPSKDTSKLAPNLVASVGEAAVNVLPDSVDFGLVTVGCKSKVEKVSVFNTGITPVYVTKVEFQGCGLEMSKVGWPGIPKKGLEVTQAQPITFGVQYGPQNVGKDACQLVVTSGNEGRCIDASGVDTGTGDCKVTADCTGAQDVLCAGQTFSVPLKGEGTLLDEYTDEFEQGAGKKVDVLFVVDNSGSMGNEQSNLASNFSQFIQLATLWQNDYHLGVVTTDMKNGGDKGKLRELNGTRVITPKTQDPTGTFKSIVKVGTGGSANEQGLAAAKAALTLPNVFDSGKSCKVDTDCADGKCVKGPDGSLGCGGHNRGFLRKQAGLELVFVSDEEDSSPSDLAYYVNFLYSIKGAANKGLFHAHAIVGLSSSGAGSGSGGCNAAKGSRYLTVAKDTGGKTASICDKSFSQSLKTIGEVAFGLSHQFFLTMTAEPSTLKVWVSGKVCSGGAKTWSYEPTSNSVIFVSDTAGGTCMPKKGDKVKIYYKTLCFP